MLSFCEFAPEAQDNFSFLSLKYRQRAKQNGGRGTDGGASAPLAPPLDPPLCVWLRMRAHNIIVLGVGRIDVNVD